MRLAKALGVGAVIALAHTAARAEEPRALPYEELRAQLSRYEPAGPTFETIAALRRFAADGQAPGAPGPADATPRTEARYLAAAAALDLWTYATVSNQTAVAERVAQAIGAGSVAEIERTLRDEMAAVRTGLFAGAATDALVMLPIVADSRLTPQLGERLRRYVATEGPWLHVARLQFVRHLRAALALGNAANVVAAAAMLGSDPCGPGAREGCTELDRSLPPQLRRARSAAERVFAIVDAETRSRERGPLEELLLPWLVETGGLLQRTAFRTGAAFPAPSLPEPPLVRADWPPATSPGILALTPTILRLILAPAVVYRGRSVLRFDVAAGFPWPIGRVVALDEPAAARGARPAPGVDLAGAIAPLRAVTGSNGEAAVLAQGSMDSGVVRRVVEAAHAAGFASVKLVGRTETGDAVEIEGRVPHAPPAPAAPSRGRRGPPAPAAPEVPEGVEIEISAAGYTVRVPGRADEVIAPRAGRFDAESLLSSLRRRSLRERTGNILVRGPQGAPMGLILQTMDLGRRAGILDRPPTIYWLAPRPPARPARR